MDVGVDTHDFRPWHYDEIRDVMMKKSQAQQALYWVPNRDHSEINGVVLFGGFSQGEASLVVVRKSSPAATLRFGSPPGQPNPKAGSNDRYVRPHSLCVSFKDAVSYCLADWLPISRRNGISGPTGMYS
jgi:hypothetical protein